MKFQGKRLIIPGAESALLLMFVLFTARQEPLAAQARDQTQAVDAEVTGRVTESGTDAPIQGASVTIHPSNPAGGTPPTTQQTTRDGAFRIPIHQAGSYIVEVRAEGYTEQSFAFLQGGAHSLQITSETATARADFVLYKGSSIDGQLIDHTTRKPLPGVTIRALSAAYFSGKLTLLPVGGPATTDSGGKFNLTGISPGAYTLEIASQPTEKILITETTRRSDRSGQPRPAYGRLFWPLGSEANPASMLHVESGQTESVGTIAIKASPRVDVHLLMGGFCPAGDTGHLMLTQHFGRTTLLRARSQFPCSAPSARVTGVSRGEYDLSASSKDARTGQRYSFERRIAIEDENITETIDLQRQQYISGAFVLPANTPPPSYAHLHVTVSPVEALPYIEEGQGSSVSEDGAFSVPLFNREKYQVRVDGLEPPYYVKQISYNGTVRDDNTFGPDLSSPQQLLEINLASDAATVQGTVTDDGKPISGASVLVVPSSDLAGNVFPTCYLLKSGDDGRFSKPGLAPGKYKVIAITDTAWSRMQRLEELLFTMSEAQETDAQPNGVAIVTLQFIITD